MKKMVEKLGWILQIMESVYKEHGIRFIYIVISRPLQYFYYKIFKKHQFQFNGKQYSYFYSLYNTTFRNERAVEVPIVMRYVEERKGGTILEVGNVLSGYFDFEHDVVDKFEVANGVINQDIVDFEPVARKYDLIVSVSTIEHVGWDELPREKDKVSRALVKMLSLLNDGGLIVVTMPIGYNGDLDRLLLENKLAFTRMHFLKRLTADNQWRETDFNEVKTLQYGYPYQNANAIVIGIVQK